jgi:hypothetical protein
MMGAALVAAVSASAKTKQQDDAVQYGSPSYLTYFPVKHYDPDWEAKVKYLQDCWSHEGKEH